jgi:hypothetical protein
MDQGYVREMIFLMMDATARDAPNVQKACNKGCQALDNIGSQPRGEKWIAVSIPPDRTWNASAQGPMPVDILSEINNEVDASDNGTVLVVGPGYHERVTLESGRKHIEVHLQPEASDAKLILYAYNPETHAQGESPSFTYTP